MNYPTEARRHAHCEICGKDLGEQSKRPQWKKRLCFECSLEAQHVAEERDLDFAAAVALVKNARKEIEG